MLQLKDDFSKTLKKVTSQTKKTTKDMTSKFKKASLAIKAAWIAIGAILIRTLNNIIKMTKAAELAQARLAQQFKNVGIHSEENIKSINKLADELQKKTAISNDEIVSSAALAASYNLNFKQIQALLPALADLTAFTMKSTGAQAQMEDTVKLMGFVLEGQIGRLKLMGITMTDVQKETIATGDSAERLAAFLEAVETNAGGVAEAMGKTMAGQMNVFKTEIDDFLKTTGGALTKFLGTIARGWNRIFAQQGMITEQMNIRKEANRLLDEEIITTEEFFRITEASWKLTSRSNITDKQRNTILEEQNKIIDDANKEIEIKTRLQEEEINALARFYSSSKENISLLTEQIRAAKVDTAERKKLLKIDSAVYNIIFKKIGLTQTDISTTEELGSTEEELKIKLEEATLAIEEYNQKVLEKKIITEEDTAKLEEAIRTQVLYGDQVVVSGDKVILTYDELNSQLKTLDDTRKVALITQGQESQAFQIANAEYQAAKTNLDGINDSLKATTESTKTYADTLISAFGSEGKDLFRGFGIESVEAFTRLQLAAGKTQEQIDEMIEDVKRRGGVVLSGADNQEKLNKEVGVNSVKAIAESKEARETLLADTNKLADGMERFKQAILDSQEALETLNDTPLDAKSATFTVTINRRIFDISS